MDIEPNGNALTSETGDADAAVTPLHILGDARYDLVAGRAIVADPDTMASYLFAAGHGISDDA